jgi:hypothetical protein
MSRAPVLTDAQLCHYQVTGRLPEIPAAFLTPTYHET